MGRRDPEAIWWQAHLHLVQFFRASLTGEAYLIKFEFYFPKDRTMWIVLLFFICHKNLPSAAPSRNAPGTWMFALSLLLYVQPYSTREFFDSYVEPGGKRVIIESALLCARNYCYLMSQ